jgi:hypothetical protein
MTNNKTTKETKTETVTTTTVSKFFTENIFEGMSRIELIGRAVLNDVKIPTTSGLGNAYSVHELYNGALHITTLQDMARSYAERIAKLKPTSVEGLSERLTAALDRDPKQNDLLLLRAEIIADVIALTKEALKAKISEAKKAEKIAELKAAIAAAKARELEQKTSAELDAELAELLRD